jgi:hypothetical protein
MKQQEGCPMAAALRKFAMRADPGALDGVCAIAVKGGTQLRAGDFNIPQIEPCLRNSASPA